MSNEKFKKVKGLDTKNAKFTNSRTMWTVASQRELINHFKDRPELWNLRNAIAKKQEIREIANSLQKSVGDVEKKWLYLTKRLVLERLKTKSNWTYLKDFLFLNTSNIVSEFCYIYSI